MEPIERVNVLFAENAQLNCMAAEVQAPAIARAAHAIVHSVLGGGKILCCGNGGSAADARYFAALMQHRFERERPGLPAITLNADAALLSAIMIDDGLREIFAKQVNALGQPGDVLLLMTVDGNASNLLAAIEAADERQMQVIALTGQGGGAVGGALRAGAVEIRTPTQQAARTLENHRLVIHCLCDLIDLQLMGG